MNSRQYRQRSRHSAFSLVELLSAIAVLAILAAILLAVVGNVRATVSKSQCAGNLRGLHAATMLWMQDNDYRLPDARYWIEDKGTTSPRYPYQIAPYLQLAPMSQGDWRNWVHRDSPFKCNAAYAIRNSTSPWGRTYSINTHATSSIDGNPPNWNFGYPRNIHEIHEPSHLALFMDGAAPAGTGNTSYWSNVQRTQVDPSGSASAPLQYPHNNSLNVVFLDGHIQNISMSTMIANYSGPSTFWRYTGQ